jgi:hypothetical protein
MNLVPTVRITGMSLARKSLGVIVALSKSEEVLDRVIQLILGVEGFRIFIRSEGSVLSYHAVGSTGFVGILFPPLHPKPLRISVNA